MEHLMTPTGVAVALLSALILDALRVGPNAFTDRVAWAIATGAIYEGFNGSPLDAATIEQATKLIDSLKGMTGGAYIAGAATEVILSMGVVAVAILTVGVLLPKKATAKFGKFAELSFDTQSGARLNAKLWGSAIILALFSDLVGGWIGDILHTFVTTCAAIAAFVPGLMGVN